MLHVVAGAARSPFKKVPRDAASVGLASPRLVRKGVVLDPGKVAAYARLCGYEGAAPVPLPYPHLLGFPLAMRIMAARDFPLPLLGLVHTGIEVTQRRALSPAERVDVAVYAEGVRGHRRGVEVVMVTEVRGEGVGEPVWVSRSTYLARAGGGDGAEAGAGTGVARSRAGRPLARPFRPLGAAPSPKGTERQEAEPKGAGRQEAVPKGAGGGVEWVLDGDLGRRYGRVSGDLNPIHLHPLTARLFGFPKAIAHGMWTFARCVAEAQLPEVVSVRAEFRAPVLLPTRVTYVRLPDNGFALRGSRDGRPHLTGTASTDLGR
ncbi:MaoC family dehydratase [Streptomyces sp. NPDC087440]|uniref:MaoC family dehydratase n=1 Tax=Streptomyces sp. NPDC087440 TaxID=3365790 RepID=UPI003829AFBD